MEVDPGAWIDPGLRQVMVMTEMIPKSLNNALEELGVSFAAIANLRSGEIDLIGDPKELGNTDLISTLFTDRETVESLNRHLERQILPRTWSQGEVACIVCKPNDETIVGLFVMDERDAVQQFHWSKKADEVIRLSFSASEF